MKWLFIFAHPDDESVACGGTIKLLSQAGHHITLISVTPGGAGEVAPSSQADLTKFGSLSKLREHELFLASEELGIQKTHIWSYPDGTINNQIVWGKLTLDIIETLEREQPDFVVTFDHTGWYYHLDHIAVSIATTRALQRTQTPHNRLILSLFHPTSMADKWPYHYPSLPISHTVDIQNVVDHKIKATQAHKSQSLDTIATHLRAGLLSQELYQIPEIHPQLPDIFVPSK